MPRFCHLRTYTAKITGADRQMIRSELREASNNSEIDYDPDTLTGTAKQDFYDTRFEWEIEPRDQAYELVERSYITRTWLYLFYATSILTAAGILVSVATTFYVSPPGIGPSSIFSGFLYEYLGSFLLFSAATFLFFLLIGSFSCPSLVTQIRGITEGHVRHGPRQNAASLLILPIGLGLAGSTFAPDLFLLTSPAAFLVFGTYTAFPKKVVDGLDTLSSLQNPIKGSNNTPQQSNEQLNRESSGFAVPVVVGEYLVVLVGILILPLICLEVSTRYDGFALATIGMAIPVAVLLQMKLVLSMASGESVLAVYMDVREGNRKEDRKIIQLLWLTGAVLLTLICIGIGVKIVDVYQNVLFNPLQNLHILIIPVSSVVPILYVFVGLGYQAVNSPKYFLDLFRSSEPFPEVIETSENVELRSIPNGSPTCLKIAGRKYIFLPQYLIASEENSLTDEELEAIIAHERRHLQNGDATLYLIVPMLSLLVLTGQNVIFGLLNFRQREHQADELAAKTTDPSTVKSALRKTRRLQRNNSETSTGSKSNGFWQQYFSLFYGTFAQSQAHPTIEERIEHIENTQP